MTIESSDSINEGKIDLQVLIEKQDTQFRELTEALKDSLKKKKKDSLNNLPWTTLKKKLQNL